MSKNAPIAAQCPKCQEKARRHCPTGKCRWMFCESCKTTLTIKSRGPLAWAWGNYFSGDLGE